MMTERDRAILNPFAAKVHQQFPDAQIWAFASRARGDAQPLCIKSPGASYPTRRHARMSRLARSPHSVD